MILSRSLGVLKTNLFFVLEGIKQISTVKSKPTSHYSKLGLNPNASIQEIKEAYYKLSKKYHPDLCKSQEQSGKFREITEAYKVLGNVKSKMNYDKDNCFIRPVRQYSPSRSGSRSRSPSRSRFTSSDKFANDVRFSQMKAYRMRKGFRYPINNFGANSHQRHYGQPERDKNEMFRNRQRRPDEPDELSEIQMDRVLFLVGCVIIFFIYFNQNDYDQAPIKRNNKKPEL